MKGNKSFLTFIKSVPHAPILILAAVVGLAVMLIPSAPQSEEESSESALSRMCSQCEGVGECTVMIVYSEYKDSYLYSESTQRVESVLVLCEGGDSAQVRYRLTELICSLYGIGANRVNVQRLSK